MINNKLLKTPKTFVVNSRLDIRSLATLAKYYLEKHQFHAKSKSSLVSIVVEHCVRMLESLGNERIKSHAEGIRVLNRMGLWTESNSTRLLMEKLQEESGLEDDALDYGKGFDMDEAVERVKDMGSANVNNLVKEK